MPKLPPLGGQTMAHGSRRVRRWLLVAAVALLLQVAFHDGAFVNPGLAIKGNWRGGPRNGSNMLLLRAEGSTDLEERRAKCPLTKEQLESDHGEKWEDVRDILVGLRAPSPEATMRASRLHQSWQSCPPALPRPVQHFHLKDISMVTMITIINHCNHHHSGLINSNSWVRL